MKFFEEQKDHLRDMRADALKFLLGLKLKKSRVGKGFSLKVLSKISGLSSSYLNEIEKGKKYPKADKLMSLAEALEMSYDDLVSSKVGTDLAPLKQFLESRLFHELPLHIYGISHNDIYEIMAQSPKKFAAFVATLMEIARSYDMQVEHLHQSALRSYQEMHHNYFPKLEEAAKKVVEHYHFPINEAVSMETLWSILTHEFKYQIDQDSLNSNEWLVSLKSVFRAGEFPKLFLNKNLGHQDKIFLLARELGHACLEFKERPTANPDVVKGSFEEVLNDFRASYFAGAILINAQKLGKKMSDFFGQETVAESDLNFLINSFHGAPELVFHRMTQLLEKEFGIDQVFFLKFENKLGSTRYQIKKELHLGQLHNPHGIGLNEHYCRRWITVSLLKELSELKESGSTAPERLIGLQRSKFLDSDKEYLCLSVATPSKLQPGTNSCTTIGIMLNDKSKSVIKFWNSPNIAVKEVSQTCERCPLSDCEERVNPAVIFEEKKYVEQKNQAIERLQ